MASSDWALVGHKLGAITVMLIISALSAYLPYLSKALTENRRLIDICSCFGGGTFLALGLFHLFPEAVHEMQDGFQSAWGWNMSLTADGERLPIPELVVFLGFALILAVERVLFSTEEMEVFHGHDHGEHADEEEEEAGEHPGKNVAQYPPLAEQQQQRPRPSRRISQTAAVTSAVEGEDVKNQISSSFRLSKVLATGGSTSRSPRQSFSNPQANASEAMAETTPQTSYAEEDTETPQANNNAMTAYLMVIALSLHSFFEGSIIGTGKDADDVWMTTIIILAHKWVAGVVLTMGFIKNHVSGYQAAIPLSVFVAATPVGALFGMAIASSASAAVCGIFDSLALGTILYVATCEIISAEFALGRNRKSKFCAFLVGAAVVFLLTMLHQVHGHSHGDGCSHGHSHGGAACSHGSGDVHGHSHSHGHSHAHGAADHGHSHGGGAAGTDEHEHGHNNAYLAFEAAAAGAEAKGPDTEMISDFMRA